jgi:hypothetical protein
MATTTFSPNEYRVWLTLRPLTSDTAAPHSTAFAAEGKSGAATLATYFTYTAAFGGITPVPQTRPVRRNLLGFRILTGLNDLHNTRSSFLCYFIIIPTFRVIFVDRIKTLAAGKSGRLMQARGVLSEAAMACRYCEV